jgi:hypothetical protein
VIGVAVVWVSFVIGIAVVRSKLQNDERPSNSQANTTNTAKASNKTSSSVEPLTSPPSSLSPSDNLGLGRKALSDGDLSTARSHSSAIPPEAKEFALAKQYLATIERREQRKSVEAELADVGRQIAIQEDMMNRTEHMLDGEGTIGKQIYLNALERKGELQLQRIKLERKLKSMP